MAKTKKVQPEEPRYTPEDPRYTKATLLQSKKFRHRRDLLKALLADDKTYTIGEVEDLVDSFMKGKVE